ncbi:MAG: phage tail assembly protein [Alphaproteobacteria bacterium]|nr:phage tail assembly protein [Alphaproteobacteria bacterium]
MTSETNTKTHKVALDTPVNLGEQSYAELHFREPTTRDMRKLTVEAGKPFAMFLGLADMLIAEPPVLIDALAISDANKVIALMSGFLGNSPQIGAT